MQFCENSNKISKALRYQKKCEDNDDAAEKKIYYTYIHETFNSVSCEQCLSQGGKII